MSTTKMQETKEARKQARNLLESNLLESRQKQMQESRQKQMQESMQGMKNKQYNMKVSKQFARLLATEEIGKQAGKKQASARMLQTNIARKQTARRYETKQVRKQANNSQECAQRINQDKGRKSHERTDYGRKKGRKYRGRKQIRTRESKQVVRMLAVERKRKQRRK